jgi:hypothetical protein
MYGMFSSRFTSDALPLQVLEVFTILATHGLKELFHHNDHGGQYLSLKYSHRLTKKEFQASSGSAGDSYRNGLAEIISGPQITN